MRIRRGEVLPSGTFEAYAVPTGTVRTRFAPSPTGYLHIGGVRTALFNWLFARQHGGAFILRVDDTDMSRNVDGALAPILDGFRWLGLDWDEGPEVGGDHGPYFQSRRRDRHQAAVEALIERGAAYRDYATPDDLATERREAEAAGRSFRYSRRFMASSEADARRFEAQGRKATVRLMMPADGVCRFTDHIRGDVKVNWAGEQDHVIQRADGTCLYHLASVVDDHDMRISHVIRAAEHLSNTPRQVFIAKSLDYPLPEYAHLPVVAEPGSRNKLSKRKLDRYLKNGDFARLNERGGRIARAIGLDAPAEAFNPVVVDFYAKIGFLPEALINYLLLLGWSYDDHTETFTRDEMIQGFSLDRVNRAPASFDPKKLVAFQARHMQATTLEQRVEAVLPFLQAAGRIGTPPSPTESRRVEAVVAAAGDRLEIAGDIFNFEDFFVADGDLAYDEKAVRKRLEKPEAAVLLSRFRDRLAQATYDAASLEALLRDFVAAEEIPVGQIIHAVRVAVTGKAVGFSLYDTLAILGRDSTLARIDRVLSRLAGAPPDRPETP
ncbi:MAG: glutamate--tRNA ligase [Acidobacteriota bacterium]